MAAVSVAVLLVVLMTVTPAASASMAITSSTNPPTDPVSGTVFASLLLLAAVVASYATSLPAGFVMDDASSILTNRSIRSLWPLGPVLIYDHEEGRTVDGRPLLNLSLAINRAVTGTAPWGFRAGNILLHWGNALLLLLLTRRLLARPPLPAAIRQQAGPLAFAASLLWAVHPLGTTAVTYIIQRAEALGAWLLLATTLTVVVGIGRTESAAGTAGAPAAGHPTKSPWGWLLLTGLLAALAGTAKETSVVIPLVTLLIDRALLAGSWLTTKKHWRWHLAAAASWPVVLVMLTVLGGRGSSAGFGSTTSPWLYLLTQARAVWLYLLRIIAPWTLVFDYGDFVSSGLGQSWPWLLLTSSVFLAVCIGYARRPVAFLGPLLFFVLLGPTSSIIPVKTQTIAEHRAYLASACLIVPAVAAGWLGCCRLGLSWQPAAAGVGLLAVLLGLGTVTRNAEFLDTEILWRKALAGEPRNERAMISLAASLIAKDRPETLAEAAKLLAAVAETGRYPRNLSVNLASLYKALGQYADALTELDVVLGFTPDDPEVLASKGFVLWKLGRLPAARSTLEQSLANKPDNPTAQVYLGNVLFDLGDLPGARRCFEAAVAASPQSANAWTHLGVALQTGGDTAAALTAFNRAIALNPENAEARYNRANLLVSLDRLADALADYTAAIALHPTFADAHYNRAVALLRRGEVAAARADIEAYRRLGGRPPAAVLKLVGLPPDG